MNISNRAYSVAPTETNWKHIIWFQARDRLQHPVKPREIGLDQVEVVPKPQSPRPPSSPLTPEQHLQCILRRYTTNPDFGAKLWLSTATGAFQAKKIDIQTRSGFLEAVFRARYYHELIRELILNVRLLPNAFVHDVLDTSQNPTVVRNRVSAETLFRRLDQQTIHLDPPELFLETFLCCAHQSDPTHHTSSLATTIPSPSTYFNQPFYGPSLSLLQGHITVHNNIFTTSAEPIHSNEDKAEEYPEPELPVRDWRKYYIKVLPILQSSGFGKTRMCVQLSTISPGMLICLRHKTQADDKQHQESFPPQDSLVFEYFQRCKDRIFNAEFPKTPEDHECFNQAHLGIVVWFAIYCKTIAFYLEQLKRNAHDCFGTPRRCDSDPRLCWQTIVYQLAAAIHSPSSGFLPNKLFEQPQTCPRIRLVQDLSDPLSSTDTTTTSTPTEQPTNRTKAELPPPNWTKTCADGSQGVSDPELLVTAIKEYLKPHLDRLEQSAPDKTAQSFSFIALDECGSMPDLLPIIRRVWFFALPMSTWILLIDTDPRLAPLADDTAHKASRRTSSSSTHRVTQPFSLMPLDVNFTEQQRQNLFADVPTFTLRKLNQLLPTLGRPLWYNKLYRSEQGVIYPRAIIDKLVYPAGWQWNFRPSWMHHDAINQNLLALVSQRIYLEVSSRSHPKSWYEFVQSQIAQHLRFIGRIYSASDSIITNTPSEPPLSAAAAWFFRGEPKDTHLKWGKVIEALVHANEPVGFNLGTKGEHGVAVLCTMAIDVAASRLYSDVLKQSLSPSANTSSIYAAVFGLVPVRRWLRWLIGDRIHHTAFSFSPSMTHVGSGEDGGRVSDAMEEDSVASSSADLESESMSPNSAFAAAGTMDETSALSGECAEELVQLWFRQAAAQCISNQSGWDFLIPVYESNTNEAPGDAEMFDKAKLSYIAIQVKNCIKQPSKAQQGHMYSQRRHPQPKTDTPLTQADQRARQLLRHHLYIAGQDGATFPQLNWLLSPAKKQVALLFGCTISVETVEFDQMQARYVRDQKSQSEQDAWDEAQAQMHGALVSMVPKVLKGV
ncbi:uncharacterized protein UHOD_08867 [Ustilago sp. UG-2017b]|nr:uncharacterized protein UHOD_08867 [Ustilago sp. UG-2017b]